MKIDYAKINDVTGEVTIDVVESDYADKIKKELKELAKKRPEPGFRPGHVPAALIEKKYGKAVRYDVINQVVADALFDYIRDQKLQVLGNPVPDKANAVKDEDKDFTLKFTVGLAPEFNVDLAKVKVPYYNIKVTDEMVDRQDDQLRRRFGSQVPGDEVDATALVKGVITELNEDGTVKEDGIVVEDGIVAPQYFKSEEQRDLFLGKHVGDTLVFNPAATCDANATEMSSMLGIPKDETDEHKGDFNFDIKEIIVLKPAELNEDFFKEAFGEDVKTEKDYREAVKKMIEASLVRDQNYRFTIDAQDALVKAAGDTELPDQILKDFLVSRGEGLTAENIDEEYGKIRGQVIWDLLKDNLIEKLNITVSEEELKDTAKMMARSQFAQYGMMNMPEDAIDKYADDILRDEKARRSVETQTVDMKFFNALKNNVKLDDKKVSVAEFEELFK